VTDIQKYEESDNQSYIDLIILHASAHVQSHHQAKEVKFAV